MTRMFPGATRWLLLGACSLAAAGCEAGPKDSVQTGYRGTGMDEIWDRSELSRKVAAVASHIPDALPPAPPPSGEASPWKNVQVLTDVSPAEFTRTMLAMSTWVAGTGNCAYCHNLADLAADTLAGGEPIYTKLTARRMLRMVRDINGNYSAHVKNTGVTCYTCHMGKPVPANVWVFDGNPNQLERYFLDRNAVRVQTHSVLFTPNENRSSVKQTEWTYGVMMKMSSSLGVSCSHCHNSRAFYSWQEAPPQRVVALLGADMVRHLNYNYLLQLNALLPASRLGPMGDAPKVQCATCHNGAYKPLYAYQMAKDYPALWGRPDWNGVPFPSAATGAAANGGAIPAEMTPATVTGPTAPTGAAASAPMPTPGAVASPTAAAPAAGGREGGPGAMGGRGPTGRDTVPKAAP